VIHVRVYGDGLPVPPLTAKGLQDKKAPRAPKE
jgi:hypothetical protein